MGDKVTILADLYNELCVHKPEDIIVECNLRQGN